jgi:H+/Cl- antiporter ClcA
MLSSIIAPSLVLGLALSLTYAAIFHLWRGNSIRDLLLYCIAAILGFGAGQLLGTIVRVPFLQIGEIHLIEATLGAWVAMAVVSLFITPQRRHT